MSRTTLAAFVMASTLTCAAFGSRGDDAEVLAAIAALENEVAGAKLEVQRLKDVDELENLASIYGHYVDKSRHEDVADLFAPEGGHTGPFTLHIGITGNRLMFDI